MKIIIAGTGAGEGNLLTLSALSYAHEADIIIVPRSRSDTQGLAERIIMKQIPDKKYIHINFPMKIENPESAILSQLEAARSEWQKARIIFFPVIGDVMLYSTGEYLLSAWRKIADIEAEFIPGVSAHSLAASCAKRFLAMRDEIFSVIPGTASRERIREALNSCNSAAIYKPTAIKNIRELVSGFAKIIRVDYAGIPELERIYDGEDALTNITEYMSVILLWKD